MLRLLGVKATKYHGVLLQPAAVLAVVRVLAVGKVLGHQPQGGGGEGSTDQVEHQHTFDLAEPKKRSVVLVEALLIPAATRQ